MTPEAAAPLRRLAVAIADLRRWRRAALAIGLGIAAAGAMPPFNLVPLLAVALTGLVWLLAGARRWRRGFLDGWLWGMGFFVPSLYWISLSMFVDIGQFWWMVPFAVLGLPAYLSLFIGGAGAMVTATTRPNGTGRLIAFAGWWVVGEWLRGHLFTGFPWLLAGYVWSGDATLLLALLQPAALVGIYGLSLGTVALAVLPARFGDPGSLIDRYRPAALGLGITGLVLAWGLVRLQGVDPVLPGAGIRIVSTDLPHRADWDPKGAAEDFRTVLALARSAGLARVTASVWPEGVVESPINRDAAARAAVAAAAPPNGVVLTGTLRADGEGAGLRAWNSVAAVGADGRVIGIYDKHHLVPFGEYVPLHDYLTFSQIAAARFDFSTGPGPATLALPGLPPVGPIICYEAIFPGEVADEANRPGWLLNVTDDGWFGRSIGPEQHFAIARVRAVEEGLPLVRAANGGISGLVDPHGRRVMTLALGEPGVLDIELPAALPVPPPFASTGSVPAMVLAALAILGGTLAGSTFRPRNRAASDAA